MLAFDTACLDFMVEAVAGDFPSQMNNHQAWPHRPAVANIREFDAAASCTLLGPCRLLDLDLSPFDELNRLHPVKDSLLWQTFEGMQQREKRHCLADG